MKYLKLSAICFFMGVIFSGCSEKTNQFGNSIPSNLSQTKLADIIKKPADYKNKQVLVEGVFAKCCDSCTDEFFCKEGINQIKVYTKGFSISKIKEGRIVKIYGEIKSSKDSSYLEAAGLELKK